jgi:hypothetical protein
MSTDQFDKDNDWQLSIRDEILKPEFYEKRYPGNYEFIAYTDPRAAGGCDTIAAGKTIDEKIVRWPKSDQEYTALAIEILSCTVEGRERAGWIYTNRVDYLLYCMANKDQSVLTCYLIDCPQLQKWFVKEDQDQWPVWRSDQINVTACRVVPIEQVKANVSVSRVTVRRPTLGDPSRASFVGHDAEGHFIHYCHCGKWGAFGEGVKTMKGQLGTWYCAQHRPKVMESSSP